MELLEEDKNTHDIRQDKTLEEYVISVNLKVALINHQEVDTLNALNDFCCRCKTHNLGAGQIPAKWIQN